MLEPVTITCDKDGCQGQIQARQHLFQMQNLEIASVIVFPHEEVYVCPVCGTHFRWMITEMPKFSVGLAEIEPPAEAPRIQLAPPNLRLHRG